MSYVAHIPRRLCGNGRPRVKHAAAAAGCFAPIIITWVRGGRGVGEARAVGGRLAGLPALLNCVDAATRWGVPWIAAAGVPAVSSAPQAPVTLPGVEYYMTNDEVFQTKRGIDGEINPNYAADSSIPTSCRSRLSIEGIQETIHEQFHATLYREHSHNALILNSGLGKYADGSFPPYLGRVLLAATSNDDDAIVWEIREQYLIPALRWVLRGLVRSGHLQEVDGSLSEGVTDDAPTMNSFGSGIVVPSHEYYYNETFAPYDIVDEKEISRKRRLDAAADADSSSEEEVELSEYEKMRAERVQRNAERLKALGLA